MEITRKATGISYVSEIQKCDNQFLVNLVLLFFSCFIWFIYLFLYGVAGHWVPQIFKDYIFHIES